MPAARRRNVLRSLLHLALFAGTTAVHAQAVAWLQYAVPPDPPRYHDLPHAVVLLGGRNGEVAPEEQEAAEELDRGLGHMVSGTDLLLHRWEPRLDTIVLGTPDSLRRARIGRKMPGWVDRPMPEDSFRIVHLQRGPRQWWILEGGSPRAELYAAFRFAALVAEDRQLPRELIDTPLTGLRAIALQGDPAALPAPPQVHGDPATVDRYAGLATLARLLASTGMDGMVLQSRYAANAADLQAMLAVLHRFGIRLWLQSSSAADLPLLSAHAATLAGVAWTVPADATASSLADSLSPVKEAARIVRAHGGTVLLRSALGPPLAFGAADTDLPAQRAVVLRGLDPNIVLTGDAVSPLLPLSGLGSANFSLIEGAPQAAEFPIVPVHAPEVAYPLAEWRQTLATPERHGTATSTLLNALQTSAEGGVVGTLTVQEAADLLHQPLQAANLFAFGAMLWTASGQDAAGTTDAWARQTWGDDARVYAVATDILQHSAAAQRDVTAPMGLPSLAGPLGGPDPARAVAQETVANEAAATRTGMGSNRSATGELDRYPDALRTLSSPAGQNWLLALRRLPPAATFPAATSAAVIGSATAPLPKSAVQTFYDLHFSGAAQIASDADRWEEVEPLVDRNRYRAVHSLLQRSAMRAEIWREVTTEWLLRVTGIPDQLGYVGNHPGRVEAEGMRLTGFTPITTTEQEDSSSGGYVLCRAAPCSASTTFAGESNVYRLEMGYFQTAAAQEPSRYTLSINGIETAHWTDRTPDDEVRPSVALPSDGVRPTGNAARFVLNGVRLRTGDRIEITGTPAPGSTAALDFLEITRDPRWN